MQGRTAVRPKVAYSAQNQRNPVFRPQRDGRSSNLHFFYSKTVNSDSLQRLDRHHKMRVRFSWVLPEPYPSMWARTASALCRKERRDKRADTGNTSQETPPAQEEDVLELGKNVPRTSSSDGSGGSFSHHPLPVCYRESPAAKRTHGTIRAAGASAANR